MTSRSSTRTRVAMGCLVLLGLAACGKTNEKAAAPSAAPRAESTAAAGKPSGAPAADANADSASKQWEKKAKAYIEINNRLLKFNQSINETFAKWEAQARARVAKGDFTAIRTDTHHFNDVFFRDLKAALDNPASMPAADAAARNLLETTQKYVPHWKSLAEYNKAKKYEDDNGAEGKRMLPMYIEGVEKINAAIRLFSDAVDVVAKESRAKVQAAYKAEGKLLELYKSEALDAARAVLDTFDSTKDLKDPAKIEKANGQLAVMEAKLVDMRAEHAKRKAESPKSLPSIDNYDSVYSSLTALAGHYREARKNPASFNEAIKAFNQAVEESNRMSR